MATECCRGGRCGIFEVQLDNAIFNFMPCCFLLEWLRLCRLGRYEEAETRLSTALKLAEKGNDSASPETITLSFVKALEVTLISPVYLTIFSDVTKSHHLLRPERWSRLQDIAPSFVRGVQLSTDDSPLSWACRGDPDAS